jgi:predicted nucleic acid-binding protein
MLTYLDTNLLVYAARGTPEAALRAFAILDDPTRTFAASVFLEMELLPNSAGAQLAFYESYFKRATVRATDLERIVELARSEGLKHGIAAMDALHLAAAASVQAQLVTYERPTRPMFRSRITSLLSIHPDGR